MQMIAETWLICGGRNFADTRLFTETMRRLIAERGCPSCVIQGGQKGADAMADNWARDLEIDCIRVAAKWTRHGKRAGPYRNMRMLNEYRLPQLVIAFPGGHGTANMVALAKSKSIDLIQVALVIGN